MNILVINCGSSSLKYQLINMESKQALAVGLAERIGIDGALTQKVEGREKYVASPVMKNHDDAMKIVLEALIDKEHGVIKSMDEIGAVGHRVVHGGERYSYSVLIDDDVMKYLNECVKLAPLHNPPNIIGIKACKQFMPNTPMVAVFDTAFHQTMPEKAFLYGIPYELYQKDHIRRYGFHGTSHKYVSKIAAECMHKNIKDLKIITCHLGNGGSVSAIKNGKSVDTSMGFTPLEGIIMGTRSGNLDPAIVTYLIEELGYTAEEVNELLNKKSGILGLSGISSDFRDIRAAAAEGNHQAQLSLDVYYYSIKKYIGAYFAIMGGLDCLVFTAGIGENAYETREGICEGLECLGIKIDLVKDKVRGVLAEVSADDSKVKIFAIPTNEELMIAEETLEILSK